MRNRRRWVVGVASVVASVATLVLASLGGACSTSSEASSAACTSLLACCSGVPAVEQAACVEAAGAQEDESCAALLSSYTAANECAGGVLVLPDGGPQGTGSCASLALCCKDAPSVEQASCNSVVTLGVASTCATTLTGLEQSGSCSSVGLPGSGDGGSFSGPSCPIGSPPQSFVGASASADCVKCANNCLSTQGFASDCDQYYACYCPCAADDTGCQQACMPLADDCPDTINDVQSCITSDCATLCTPLSSDPVGCVDDADAGTGVCALAILGDAGTGISCSALNLQSGTCPSANLVGCCTRPFTVGLMVECYYDATLSGQDESDCQTMEGIWSTVLP